VKNRRSAPILDLLLESRKGAGLMNDNSTLGSRLRRLRHERKLTQEDVAGRAGISTQTVAKTEQGKMYPRLPMLQRLADSLDVPLSELADSRPRLGGADDASVLALRDAILSPAILGLSGEDTEPLTPEVMREAVDGAARDYWAGDLARLAATLPGMIGAARATRREHGTAAAVPLVLAYDRAAGLLVHLGREDLAAVAAERAITAAADGDDGQLLATMHGTYAWVLLHQGRHAEAEKIAADAARRVQPGPGAGDRDLAVYGNILMTAVGPAAAAGRDVGTYITEAGEAAGRMSGPAWLWATNYSRSSVWMQATYAHAVQREPGRALEAARNVDPADLPGTISWGRHLLDVAQAHVDNRHAGAAVAVLTQAHEMAPVWFRHQEVARLLIAELLEWQQRQRIYRQLSRLAAATGAGGYAAYYRPPR
jgi:transcriptional regulator with XRE-family HTH domain